MVAVMDHEAKGSEERFRAYGEALAEVIGHADREQPLRDYCLGLLMPGERKNNGTRYRYYVSRPLITQGQAGAGRGRRVPAGDLERLVEDRVVAFLQDRTGLFRFVEPFTPDVNARKTLVERAAHLLADGTNSRRLRSAGCSSSLLRVSISGLR